MAANYNNAAWFYDRLSRLVYGTALIDAQKYLVQFIPANSKILIVGGGTGWILEEIATIHQSGLQITYVEVATKMMALSKQRKVGDNKVIFINEPIENMSLPPDFDIVFTPFLFDNFTQQSLQNIFRHINALLEPNALWLNSSFQLTGKCWQNLLLKTMFVFFRLLCRIEASKLPDIEKQFELNGYKSIEQSAFFGDFVGSKVYSKRPK